VLYTLNRDHIAAPVALALVSMRSALLDRLRAAVADWEVPAAHVSLFGSAARGDGDISSDIDLFIVRPAAVSPEDQIWRAQLDSLSRNVSRWTGNHAGISEIGERELPALGSWAAAGGGRPRAWCCDPRRPRNAAPVRRSTPNDPAYRMSPARRVKTRTQPCNPEQARKRLADARKFLELAEMVDDGPESTSLWVSSANAVLAGIAAADAACSRALGERSRDEEQRDAVKPAERLIGFVQQRLRRRVDLEGTGTNAE